MRNVKYIHTAYVQTDFYLVAEGSSPLRQVEHGQEGELCIGGVGVALGYLHAPDLTAQVRIRIHIHSSES